jgi:DNA-binding MarR family transcriptional regulator
MARSTKSDKAKSALEQSPSHLMHRALQLALDIYSEQLGPEGLTQRQFAVLAVVEARPGLTQSDLVKTTGIDRSTLADLVARMTAKGLLERERSTLDARAMAVRLTETGLIALTDARPKVAVVDKRILSLLPKAKRNGFMDLLTGLAAAADAAPELAKAEARAAKKATKDARKAERSARKRAETEDGAPKKKKKKSAPLKEAGSLDAVALG